MCVIYKSDLCRIPDNRKISFQLLTFWRSCGKNQTETYRTFWFFSHTLCAINSFSASSNASISSFFRIIFYLLARPTAPVVLLQYLPYLERFSLSLVAATTFKGFQSSFHNWKQLYDYLIFSLRCASFIF